MQLSRLLTAACIALLTLPIFVSAATCPNLTRNLSFGSRGSDVIQLQNFLIAQGHLAVGNNTGYFGNLTRSAVRAFQCTQNIVCSGTESTTGYGVAGPRTRVAIAAVCKSSTQPPISDRDRCANIKVLTSCPIGQYQIGTGECGAAICAAASLSCTSDTQCPSNYICEAIESYGTACAHTNGQPIDPNCTSTTVITKGICKLKEGQRCGTSADCTTGMLCNAGVCTNPVGKVCYGAYDTSCGAGWQCVQDCGPPVSSQYDQPPGYHCMLNEEAAKPRVCPICLAGSTLIDTPSGRVSAQDIHKGMSVWTVDSAFNRVIGTVSATSKVPVTNHTVVHLQLSDGRNIYVSPGHPTIDGRTVGDLKVGEKYDNATIVSAKHEPYTQHATYDLLPSGTTGYYWADGILLGSTLK